MRGDCGCADGGDDVQVRRLPQPNVGDMTFAAPQVGIRIGFSPVTDWKVRGQQNGWHIRSE